MKSAWEEKEAEVEKLESGFKRLGRDGGRCQGLGFRVSGLGFRVWGLGFRV